MNKPISKTRSIFVLWAIGYVIAGILSSIYKEFSQYHIGYPLTQGDRGHLLVILAFVSLFSVPLLFQVQKAAKNEKKRGFLILSRFLLFQHFVWIICCIISVVFN